MENKNKFENYPYKKDGLPVFFLHLCGGIPQKTLAAYCPFVSDLNYAVNELVDGAKHDGGAGRVALVVGVSCLHPKDKYNKSIGRRVSMGKMRPVFAWVKSATIDEKGVFYTLDLPEDGLTVNFFAKHGETQANMLHGYSNMSLSALAAG